MKSYSETHVFSALERRIMAVAVAIVKEIPNSEKLRCHEVARAVSAITGLPFVDGFFGSVNHTWIIIRPAAKVQAGHATGRRPSVPDRIGAILDPYAVGSLPQVQMHDASFITAHMSNYRPGPPRTDIDHDLVEALVKIARRALSVQVCSYLIEIFMAYESGALSQEAPTL